MSLQIPSGKLYHHCLISKEKGRIRYEMWSMPSFLYSEQVVNGETCHNWVIQNGKASTTISINGHTTIRLRVLIFYWTVILGNKQTERSHQVWGVSIASLLKLRRWSLKTKELMEIRKSTEENVRLWLIPVVWFGQVTYMRQIYQTQIWVAAY